VSDFLRRYTLVCYIIALTFMIASIVDVATNAWPWFIGNEQWRFGAVAILSNYLISIIFGVLLLAVLGVARATPGALYFVTAVSALVALFLFVIMIGYSFDTLQLMGSVREEQVEMFKIGAAKTLFKTLLFFTAALAMSIASFKAARDVGAPGRH